MIIQTIATEQIPASLQLITAAFATAAHSDGNEAELTTALRASTAYRPEFDVIAQTTAGTLIGHGLLSMAHITSRHGIAPQTVAVLAPLAVLPEYQGQGIGRRLLGALEERAVKADVTAISILGDPAYYGQFGYVPASQWHISAPFPVDDQFFMMKQLTPHALDDVAGTLCYDAAFGLSS